MQAASPQPELERLVTALGRIENALATREKDHVRLQRIEAEAREILTAVDTLLEMPS
ncbi:hypothetical protein [Polymorphobacter sp.]|uniref:hypothetical protein n=1 Tax=Polymorphobacter sp. TaxID=1909290 RepID=UPI003F70E894